MEIRPASNFALATSRYGTMVRFQVVIPSPDAEKMELSDVVAVQMSLETAKELVYHLGKRIRDMERSGDVFIGIPANIAQEDWASFWGK